MPVDTAAQPCEVCGILTTSRCAACESAGISLFFCSRAHQKLVWPAHKVVCGPGKAHPFAMLPLADVEIAKAKTLLGKRLHSVAPAVVQNLRSTLEKLSALPAEEALDYASGDVHDLGPLPNKPVIVALVRSALSHLSVSVETPDLTAYHLPDEDYKTFQVTVAAQLCSTMLSALHEELCALGAWPLDYVHELWFSLVQHKIYILTRLAQVGQRPGAEPEDVALFETAKNGFNAWLRAGMGTGNILFILVLSTFQFVFELKREQWVRNFA